MRCPDPGTTLYDGTGAAPRRADVALRGDRIASVGDGSGLHANASLDAAGLALAPGFIDVHTHDDFALVVRPEMDFKILGGVTTVVVGNCGMGAAPWPLARGMAAAFHPGVRLPEWSGYSGYFAQLEREPASVNAAALVGHGTARLSVMGNAKRAPSDAELELLRAIVREGRDAGAVGFSTGLIYEPGCHADAAEVTALAGEFAGSGGVYATHMRDEGLGLLDSVRESIEVGRRTGLPVEISHHKASGQQAWGMVKESLALIERAQAEGLDVHADQYPYTAGSTGLAAIIQNGTFDGRPGGLGRVPPEKVTVAAAPGHPEWEGRSIAELARLLDVDAAGRGRARRRQRTRRHRGDPLDERGRRAHGDAPSEHDDRLRRHPEPAGQAAPAPVGNVRARARPLRARARAVSARGGGAPHDRHGGARSSAWPTAARSAPAPSRTSSSSIRRGSSTWEPTRTRTIRPRESTTCS